jgi:hypothetical protein
MFFVFGLSEVEADARYIQEQYFPSFQLTDLNITKVTRLKQQGVILALFNYRFCDAKQRQALSAKACQAAKVSSKPIYVFRGPCTCPLRINIVGAPVDRHRSKKA